MINIYFKWLCEFNIIGVKRLFDIFENRFMLANGIDKK